MYPQTISTFIMLILFVFGCSFFSVCVSSYILFWPQQICLLSTWTSGKKRKHNDMPFFGCRWCYFTFYLFLSHSSHIQIIIVHFWLPQIIYLFILIDWNMLLWFVFAGIPKKCHNCNQMWTLIYVDVYSIFAPFSTTIHVHSVYTHHKMIFITVVRTKI